MIRYTVPHYYDFGPSTHVVGEHLGSAESWERLRLSDDRRLAPAFALPSSRQEWLLSCGRSVADTVAARDLANAIRAAGFRTIVSVGVGRGAVEYHLKRELPHVRVVCAEQSARLLEPLRRVFVECDEFRVFDVRCGDWAWIPSDAACVFNRIDTELDDDVWRSVFHDLGRSGVQSILVVATGFLTPRTAAIQVWRRASAWWRRARLTCAGYLRTKPQFVSLWSADYVTQREISVGTLSGFILKRKT